MSSTLLRLGLWIVLLVAALYVVNETFENSPIADFIPANVLQYALALGVLLVVAGLVARVVAKAGKKVNRPKCAVCKKPVAQGAIYCREHLRRVLYEEDEKFHNTVERRNPVRPPTRAGR
jgi:hypothetical protein